MGIVAGIAMLRGQDPGLARTVLNMVGIQRHRDAAELSMYSSPRYAIATANSHDLIHIRDRDVPDRGCAAVLVLVDGIVLDTEDSRRPCTSLIREAYERYGLDFMAHLEGEFACAVWDERKGRLILARDPYGHKPLHYFRDDDKLYFSSEIKGLLSGGVKAEIDFDGLSSFLSLNCIPFPGTMYRNIKQVCPGQLVIVSGRGVEFRQYWRPVLREDEDLCETDACVLLADGLRQAVRKRMIRDEVYCFLSGGIDSSAVVSFAAELSGKPVNAVTVSFDEAEENELEDAEVMARHVGARLFHVTATSGSFFDMLDTLVFHHDQPFTDTSAYPSYYAGKLARELTDVILTGDGPDQTMGGSSHHVFALQNGIFEPRNRIWRAAAGVCSGILGLVAREPGSSFLFKLRRKFYRDSLSPVAAAYDVRSYFPDLAKRYLVEKKLRDIHTAHHPFRHPERWFSDAGQVSAINKYLYADMMFYVPDDLMIKVDRMSMAHGLETLSPFQDTALAGIINRLPVDFKIRKVPNGGITTKYLLKELCRKRFPERLLTKKKQGFGIPLDKWLRQDGGERVKRVLFDPRSLNRGLFDKRRVVSFVNDFLAGKGDYYYPNASGIVALLTLELWQRAYIDTHIV